MEITSKSPTSFYIKGKRATLAINSWGEKVDADALIITDSSDNTVSKDASRVVITGPGEYEVSGVSIVGEKADGSFLFRILIEGVSLLYLGALPKEKNIIEQFSPVDILILGDYSDVIYELDPKIIIPFTSSLAEKLGKDITSEKKLSVTKEKLPQDLKVVMLHG